MSDRIEINSAYIEQIASLIDANNSAELSLIIADLHIADIAEIIDDLSIDNAHSLFDLIEEEKSALVLVELEDDTLEEILSYLTAKEIAEEVIGNLESDDAADVIGKLSQDKKETKTPINPHEVGVYDTDLLPASFHTDRREQLRNLMPDSSVAIFFSAPIRNRSNDVDFEYHQDPNFRYLTGLNEPHSLVIIYKHPTLFNLPLNKVGCL